LSQVRDTVTAAVCWLTNTGTVAVSVDQLTAALWEWLYGLDDIISTSWWMADTLGDTWRLIQKHEEDNTDLAAGITNQAEPLAPTLPRMLATGATVAPGQTVGSCARIQAPLAPEERASS